MESVTPDLAPVGNLQVALGQVWVVGPHDGRLRHRARRACLI